jgi:hypothetical protein
MTSSKFPVATAFRSLRTRESGSEARQAVLEALKRNDEVVLDFTDAHPTPSFADELVGHLAAFLGESVFRGRVRITGVGETERPLLQQVIRRRLQRQEQQTLMPSRTDVCDGMF